MRVGFSDGRAAAVGRFPLAERIEVVASVPELGLVAMLSPLSCRRLGNYRFT